MSFAQYLGYDECLYYLEQKDWYCPPDKEPPTLGRKETIDEYPPIMQKWIRENCFYEIEATYQCYFERGNLNPKRINYFLALDERLDFRGIDR